LHEKNYITNTGKPFQYIRKLERITSEPNPDAEHTDCLTY